MEIEKPIELEHLEECIDGPSKEELSRCVNRLAPNLLSRKTE